MFRARVLKGSSLIDSSSDGLQPREHRIGSRPSAVRLWLLDVMGLQEIEDGDTGDAKTRSTCTQCSLTGLDAIHKKPVIRETNGGVTVTVWGMESPLLGDTPVIPISMDLALDEIDNLSDENLGRMIDNGFLYLFSGDRYDDLEYFPRSVRPPDDEDEDAISEIAPPGEQ